MEYIDYRLHYACALMSQIAYPDDRGDDWPEEKEEIRRLGFTEIDGIESYGTAQFRVARSDGRKILAIRGTTYEDIRHDLNVVQMQDPAGVFPGKVHSGFWHHTEQFINAAVLNVVVGGLDNKDRETTLTGHSLGAACAAIIQGRLSSAERGRRTEVISFGCPRFAGYRYRSVSRRRGYRHYRWVHANDGVTRIPWHPARYAHSGTPCYIRVTGQHIIDPPAGYITLDRFGRFQRSPFRWASSLRHDHEMKKYTAAMKEGVE